MSKTITQEEIESFLMGEDTEPYIVGIEYDYPTNTITRVIQHPEKGKILKKDSFTPFLWVGDLSGLNFYKNDKDLQRRKMAEHGITIKKLETHGNSRLENGMTHLVKSTKGYTNLIAFFKQGGIDPWGEKHKKYFTILGVSEQYLIQKKKRLFKGIDEYNDVHRLVFDIETTGLNPETDRIILIGMKDNRGLQKTISAFGDDGEKLCIIEFFEIIKKVNPTIIGGYNSAEFDWPFILRRADILGLDIKKLSKKYTDDGIKKKDGMLKLASEMESYNHYMLWGFNIIDISHGVRRAQAINSDIKSWGLKYINKYLEKEKPNRVYVDGAFISKIYLENENYYVNPKTGKYKKIGEPGTENLQGRFPGKYEIWGGKRIVEQYLDDDLYETMIADDSFSQATFLISKLVPTTYERVATMGTATLWKLIMLAWSYENNLAIPAKFEKRRITGGLSRLLLVGYAKNIVKFDFSSLYPSIDLFFNVFSDCDVMGVQKALLKYFRNVRITYKREKERLASIDPAKSEMFDRKQLPLKIFINAFFGSLSAPLVYPWGDMDLGEMTTCIGRQELRKMIMWFKNKGYVPLVMDTDGVNFEAPADVETRKYIGKGLNDLAEKGKEYTGIAADCAEFNDIFMRNEMGLDIDYTAISCINLSRKNYIIKTMKKGKTKIKLTGNSIKSKKIQKYVEEFLDEGLPFLMDGDGLSFIELYYSYVNKIYNKEIPLAKIANKARVKQTVEEYKKYIKKTTKAGNLMARQAHMELLMNSDYPASLGETIYYINNGTKKGDGDVKKVTKYERPYTRKEMKEYVTEHGKKPPTVTSIDINCYMIPESEIMNNPDKLGDYNVPRYLEMFNKKVKPLLVVFNPEIRNDILVDDPQKRGYFTKSQCELDNGHPLEEKGQDNFNEVMTLSDTEVEFWNKIGRDPYFMYVEDSLQHVDQYWVEHNREVVRMEAEATKDNPEEDTIETNGEEYLMDLIFS